VGIVANNGVLFSESAQKGAHFVELCSQRKIPLVFLQNITGFMVGRKYENEGIARHGAKMVTAVATTAVPKMTLLVGGSFGAGNYGMAGRAYRPASCGPGPIQPDLGDGRRAGGRRAGHRETRRRSSGPAAAWSAEEEAAFKRPRSTCSRSQSHPLYASARLWDDGIIDPRKTREVLALSCRRRSTRPSRRRASACSGCEALAPMPSNGWRGHRLVTGRCANGPSASTARCRAAIRQSAVRHDPVGRRR
jgi:3-methylcrotonyl-CoA carboxylase beta subunit